MNQHQKDILHKISELPTANYNSLRNEDLDPKQSAYHLQKLIKEGLIVKMGNVYLLTLEGKKALNIYQHEEDGEFQIGISNLLYVVSSDGKVLIVTREKAPFIGYKGNPTTRVKVDQLSEDAAKEDLLSYGISETPELAGIMDYMYEDEDGTNSKTVMFVYYLEADLPEGTALREGTAEWISKDDLLNASPGFDNTKDVVKVVEDFQKEQKLQFVSKRYKTKL
jgi:hypothetical protein